MKVTLEFGNHSCTVEQTPDDPRRFHSGYEGGESWFYHAVARELKKQGYDVVKKLMWKDGHLVSEHQYYIRERKGAWAIWDTSWQIRGSVDAFRENGKVNLRVVLDKELRFGPVYKGGFAAGGWSI